MSNGILLLHVINLVGALISAWFTVLQRNLVRAVIGQAVMGSFVALEFLLLNAPTLQLQKLQWVLLLYQLSSSWFCKEPRRWKNEI